MWNFFNYTFWSWAWIPEFNLFVFPKKTCLVKAALKTQNRTRMTSLLMDLDYVLIIKDKYIRHLNINNEYFLFVSVIKTNALFVLILWAFLLWKTLTQINIRSISISKYNIKSNKRTTMKAVIALILAFAITANCGLLKNPVAVSSMVSLVQVN